MTQEDYDKLVDLILEAANSEDPIGHLLFAIACQWSDLDKNWQIRAEKANCHPE